MLVEDLKDLEDRGPRVGESIVGITINLMKYGASSTELNPTEAANVGLVLIDNPSLGIEEEDLKNWLDGIHFAHEDDLQLPGGKGRYYRIEAEQPSLFTLSGGWHVMESVPITGVGKRLLQWVCGLLEVEDKRVLKYIDDKELEATVEYKAFPPNLIQIVVSQGNAHYATHNDQGPEMSICFIPPKPPNNGLEGHIPYDYEQRVVTLVLVFPIQPGLDQEGGVPESGEQAEAMDGWCDLCHYTHDSTTGKYTQVSTITTKGRSVHIQGFGAQRHLKHDVKSHRPSTNMTQVKRVILSFRTTASLSQHKDSLVAAIRKENSRFEYDQHIKKPKDTYRYVNVLRDTPKEVQYADANLCWCSPIPIGAVADDVVPVAGLLNNVVSNFNIHEESTKLVPRPGYFVAAPGPALDYLRSSNVVRALLSNDMYLSAQGLTEDNTELRWLQRKHVLGSKQNAAKIRTSYRIKQNTKQVEVFHTNMPFPDVLVLEQVYKNKFTHTTTDEVGFGFRDILIAMEKDPSWIYNQDDGRIELWVGPRGGNGDIAGKHGQAPPSSLHRDTTHYSATHQKMPSNKGLNENLFAEAAFHMFVPLTWMEEDKEVLMARNSSKRSGKVMYLGIWYFARAEIKRRKHMVMECNHNTRWLGEQCFLYYVRPLFNKSNPPPANLHDERVQLKAFTISKTTQIRRWFPEKTKSNQLLGVNSEEVVGPWLKAAIAGQECDAGSAVDQPTANLLTLSKFITQSARIAIAAFARTANMNVVTNTKNGECDQLKYLCGKSWQNLGWVLGTNSVPNPIRTYNLQTIAFIAAAGLAVNVDPEGKRRHYVRLTSHDPDEVVEYLFRASVLRLAGTVGVYIAFAEHWKQKYEQDEATHVKNILIPGIAKLGEFREFLQMNTEGGGEGKMGPYTKCLYHDSLPGACTSNVDAFCGMLESLAHELPRKLLQMLRQGVDQNGTKREDFVTAVAKSLETCNNRRKGNEKYKFLASLMVADVEEVMEDPFGTADHVVLGYGGKRGLQLLETSEENHDGSKATRILNFLDKDAPITTIAALGLYREGFKVYVLYNRRRLTIADIDNIACKMSVCQGKTTGARLIIGSPGMNSLHDFPVLPNWRNSFDLGLLLDICNHAVAALPRLPFGKMSNHFQFNQEASKWPKFCTEVDNYWGIKLGLPPTRGEKRKRGS
jgi:hypothetical protein